MKSFIGWIGGKSHLKKFIIPLIPNDCDRYIEVCGGAGWVLFGKEKIKGQMEVFNDIDCDLINLYKQIKNNCDALQKEIDWLQSRKLFNTYRYEIENGVELSDLQRAARYLYLIKCSFGSNRNSFATAPKSIYNIIDELPAYKERLRNVIIENRDFENLIKTYDRPSALFYVDPPYVNSEKYYNKKYSHFTMNDHKRLNSILKAIKGRFILSYNDCDFVRNAYKDFNIQYVSRDNLLPAKASDRNEYKEVIITNFVTK
jgi:DNA adenine methylase